MQIIHSKSTVNTLKSAAICAVLFVLLLLFRRAAAEILSILFGGSVLAFLFAPLTKLVEKKLPRSAAALISIIGICLLVAGGFVLLAPFFLRQLSALTELLPEAFLRLRTLVDGMLERLRRVIPDLTLPEFSFAGAENRLGSIARSAAGAISGLADKAYRLFLMGALSYFMVTDRERMLLRLELLVPARWRRLAVRAGNMFLREMRLYLRGQATIALTVGILATSALTIIGVPGAPLLGLFVGMFNVIPYIGPFLGGIPAVIMALSISWQRAAFTLLSLFLVQQIDGMVISPRIMGNITGFSPAVVLLAVFVGARTIGIGGMLFALPSLMAIRTVYRVFVQRHENN